MTFGDDDPADAYDASTPADPVQVARRLHEIRAYVDQLAGTTWADRFDELAPDEQDLAAAIGGAIVGWLLARATHDPVALAQHIHTVRRYLSGNVLDPWHEIPDDHRDVAVAVTTALVDWLEAEGTI